MGCCWVLLCRKRHSSTQQQIHGWVNVILMAPKPSRDAAENLSASETRLRGYARDALSLLEANLRLYRQGQHPCYRVAALELRLLLCDTTRIHSRMVDISLAGRLWPELRLHRLSPAADRLEFESDPPSLDRTAWLAQPLLSPESSPLTLRGLIRLVCDRDGGAHVDPRDGSPIPAQAPGWIVDTGEYILGQLTPLVTFGY
jgi:hypothetical protein